MDTDLSVRDFVDVLGTIRTREQQDVPGVTRAILERIALEDTFVSKLQHFVYMTRRQSLSEFAAVDWSDAPSQIAADLSGESRALLHLRGTTPGMKLWISLHCTRKAVSEIVDGSRREVPEPSQDSVVSLSAAAKFFADPTFAEAYVRLLADVFGIVHGAYGYAQHTGVKHGNDFDRVNRDLYQPSFLKWLNFFGPDLVAQFGRVRLLSAPAFDTLEMPSGGVQLRISRSPLEQLAPEVRERMTRVQAHLGIQRPSERLGPDAMTAFGAVQSARDAEMRRRVGRIVRDSPQKAAVEMQRQAEGCAMGARRFWGVSLDFGPDSLALADGLITTGFSADESQSTIETAIQAFGAYLGEVTRRTLGGVWRDAEMSGQPMLQEIGPAKLSADPFQAVRQRFENRHTGGPDLPAWYRTVLSQGGPFALT